MLSSLARIAMTTWRRRSVCQVTLARATCLRRYYPGTDNVSEVKQAGLEPGPPQRLRVVATYEAAAGLATNIAFGGLCNQIYSHVNMLAVLLHMGAELVRRSDLRWPISIS